MIFLFPCDLSLHVALTCHGTGPDRGSFGSNPWPMLTIVSESFVEFGERGRENVMGHRLSMAACPPRGCDQGKWSFRSEGCSEF